MIVVVSSYDNGGLLALFQLLINNMVICWWRFWWISKMKTMMTNWDESGFHFTCYPIALSPFGSEFNDCGWILTSEFCGLEFAFVQGRMKDSILEFSKLNIQMQLCPFLCIIT